MENILEASINFSRSIIDSNTQFVLMISSGIEGGVMMKYKNSTTFKEELFIFLIFLNYKKVESLYHESSRFITFKLSLLNTLKNSHGMESRENLESYIKRFQDELNFINLIDISLIKYFIKNFSENSNEDLLMITSCLDLMKPMISSIDSINKEFLKLNYNLTL